MTRGRPVKRRKRGNGEGSIIKEKVNGSSYFRIKVTLPDGKSKYKRLKTLVEAKETLLRMRAEIASGVMPSDMTFTEWSEHWLSTRRGLKEITLYLYRHIYILTVARSNVLII